SDRRAVELQLAPGLSGDGVGEHAVRRAGLRMHPDEERGVAALLEQLGVLGPVVLHDELAVRVELVGNEGVERPFLARAVTVHDHDVLRARGLRAAHGSVDLLGVELAPFVVRALLLRAVGLLPLDDARDALHVADDEDLHSAVTAAGVLQGKLIQCSVRRQTKSERTTLCGFSYSTAVRTSPTCSAQKSRASASVRPVSATSSTTSRRSVRSSERSGTGGNSSGSSSRSSTP